MSYTIEILKNIYGLATAFIVSLLLLIATFSHSRNINGIVKYFKTIRSFRIYLISVIVFIIITISLWYTDIYVTELPDPVIAYILFVLILSVAYGFGIALFTGLFSFLLVDFYLFEPRYHFYTRQEAMAIVSSLVGFLLTLIIGALIRNYQQRLIKKNTDLRHLLKARDRFAAVTAHDLKNPISTIKLYTQMLSKQTARKHADKLLSKSAVTINEEADKLLSMIDLLLDFSKLESGKLVLKKDTCDLFQLCKEKVGIMQSLHPTHIYQFKSDLKTAIVYADKLAIDRVIINLLTNATKYSAHKTTILVELYTHADYFVISVKDQGKGISLKHQKRLFEPFYQTSETNKGLGLGLYIVKSIIELHKGTIHVDSAPNHGSTFYISLPANSAPRKRLFS